MRVKCFVQEHNTMSQARTRTRTTGSGGEHTNHEATTPSTRLGDTELSEKKAENCSLGQIKTLIGKSERCVVYMGADLSVLKII